MIDELLNLPDVSFIENKQLDQVQEELIRDYQDRYKEITGKDIVLDRADPNALTLYAVGIQIFQAMMYVDKAGKQDLLKYSYGPYLDNFVASQGISREKAKPARTMVRFTLSEQRPNATEIPPGTRVTHNGSLYFETEDFAVIETGSLSADIMCICMTAGTSGNNIPAGMIDTLVDPIPYMASVSNTEPTTGGADIEDDDTLKDRFYVAPSRYSVAGPEDAYQYWARTYNANISDVRVFSDKPVDVVVEFIMKDGELPSESMIRGLQAYLEDGQIRPLTDKVTVKAPEIVEYNLNVKYFVNTSDKNKADTLKAAIEAAAEDYIIWQRSRIGRDINPSQLIQKMVAAGAKRVEVTEPVFKVVGKANVAKLSASKTITYGGLEDD